MRLPRIYLLMTVLTAVWMSAWLFPGSARAGYVDNKNGTVTDGVTGLV